MNKEIMDLPGTSTTDTNNLCELCNTHSRKYTCPRCGIGYCNIDCYKSEAHLECSESFYKQCIEEELKSQEKDPEDRNKMIEILRRVHEQDLKYVDLETDGTTNEEEEELEEQMDSDDEEDALDLEQRLQNINLDNADEVWSALTEDEKQQFEALLKNGEIEKLLPEWIPWWTYHVNRKLIQDMSQQSDKETNEFPALVQVPLFNELQKASPNVQFNITNVIYAYTYIANYYNGDYLNCPLEATIIFLDLCDNMKLNNNYDNAESAIASVINNVVNCNWLPQDEQTVLAFKKAGDMIMQGPGQENKYFYISIALSELHRLLTTAKKELSKYKNKPESKEFSKKFAQRYNTDYTNLSKKTLLLYCKKLEYYLSWCKGSRV
ncbi:zinc finger HIT domain-containing protein 2 [Calliopsis andreniformis]|uniref:zinc finger HIT domain-containing protein 2 n=1 Tax=Calliopsis andreniformis TaxID=337506 RepID=UPI003FCEDCF0